MKDIMKLAEALSIRAELQKKTEQLEQRLKSVVKIQEGDTPEESPADLLAELYQATAQLEKLLYRINLTNLYTVRDGEPITAMIARKDVLTLEINVLRNVLKAATEPESRYSRSEINYVKTVDTAKLRKKIDTLSAELRKTDLKIQETNWTADLMNADSQDVERKTV